MRVNPNLVPDVLAGLQQSSNNGQYGSAGSIHRQKRQCAVRQSYGIRRHGAEHHRNSKDVDQYTQNTSTVLSMVQTADSALGSVVSSLTQAITLGTEGANGTTNAADQQAIATQVQGILSSVVSAANTTYQGSYLFGGTANTTTPYTADATSPSGYTYNGNSRGELRCCWRRSECPDESPGEPDFLKLRQRRSGIAKFSRLRTSKRK